MTNQTFRVPFVTISIAFVAYSGVVVVPPLLSSGDIGVAFAAGFVNPYALVPGVVVGLSAYLIVRGQQSANPERK